MAEKSLAECQSLSQQLFRMQADCNDGRGICCVRTACLYLERGEWSSARAVCANEGDKMRSYPAIWQFLLQHGLRDKGLFER